MNANLAHLRRTLGIAAVALAALASRAAAQANWPADFAVAQPNIPDKTFKLTDYGAIPDGKTLNTAAITKAIAAVTAAGGGTLEVPPGTYLTGPFALASSLNLHLDDGARILLSDNRADFKRTGDGYENCITADNCHDLAITGPGTIDGHGQSWWAEFQPFRLHQTNVEPPHRPYLLMLSHITRLLVRDVTLTNSPMITLIPRQAHDATIDSIKVISPADSPNTDGIDPSGSNIHIVNCTVDTGDDDIVLKPHPVEGKEFSCENILVEKCTIRHGHGMSIGGGSNGGVRNLLVRDCTFTDTDFGVRLKSGRDRGGLAEDLTYQNLTMKHVGTAVLITSYYPTIPAHPQDDAAKPVAPKTPIWRHVLIENVTATESGNPLRIVGLPEMPVQDVTFRNVHLSGEQPAQIIHARDIKFVDSTITSTSGKPPQLIDADIQGKDVFASR